MKRPPFDYQRDSDTLIEIFLCDRERAHIYGEGREWANRHPEAASKKYQGLLKARNALKDGLSKEAHTELCRWPNNYSTHCHRTPFTPEWDALNPRLAKKTQ